MTDYLLNKIRLKDFELQAIKDSFAKYFATTDHLWIFGSRVDLNKRGGDIDLYVETTKNSVGLVQTRLDFIIAIEDKIGEQKIDVVINIIDNNLELPIYALAKKNGVQLA